MQYFIFHILKPFEESGIKLINLGIKHENKQLKKNIFKKNYDKLKNYVNSLLHSVIFLYTPHLKYQNMIGFLMFSDGIKRQHWEVMG